MPPIRHFALTPASGAFSFNPASTPAPDPLRRTMPSPALAS